MLATTATRYPEGREAGALRLSPDLELPPETVTQAIAILAKRRAGKSYTAARLVEELFAAGQQVVVVDPKGDWWGLRSSADGSGPGLPILILGGERGDLPLEPDSGELVARFVVERGASVLLDLSGFRKVAVRRGGGGGNASDLALFAGDFLEALYRLKARERYRTPLMLVIDEADVIASQRPGHGDERMLGAADDIVRRGGQRGLGCTMVSQRAAVLNKNVLSQIELLVALKTLAPQDLGAIGEWVDAHGTPEQRRELLGSLPSLPVGEAWFWSPGWPTDEGIFRRVAISTRRTWDSGATPKSGERPAEARTVAEIDVEALGAQLSALAAKRRDEDPALLRARIAELEGMLGAGSVGGAERVVEVERRVEVPVPLGEDLVRLEGLIGRIESLRGSLGDAAGSLLEALRPALAQLPAPAVAEPIPMTAPTRVATPPATDTPPHSGDGRTPRETSPRSRTPTRGAAPIRSVAPADRRQPEPEQVAEAERAVLATLARHPEGRSRAQLALIAGYAPADPALARALAYLRTEGHLEGGAELLTLTPSGREAAGEPEPLPTGRALVELWERSLPTAQRRLLQAALEAYPGSASRAQLGRAAGYKVGAGAFNAALQRLRALGLVGEAEGGLRASPAFFGE